MLFGKTIHIICFLVILIVSVSAKITSDDLPLNIKRAYQSGTRSFDGKPGNNYWQNHAQYSIDITLVPAKYLVKGAAEIIYTNESPDTLNQLVFHLYPDLMKKDSWRDMDTDPADYHDGVEIIYLEVAGQEIDADGDDMVSRYGTNMNLRLEEPLLPGEDIDVNISWRYNLARHKPIRTGAYRDSLYFLAYWYPKIAVYDDIDGWDHSRYMGKIEFYNDLNDFDVRISVPEDYLVWATGILENGKEVLRSDIYSHLTTAQTADSIIAVIDRRQMREKDYFVAGQKNIWHYRARSVPDFTIAVSNCFLWDATSVVVDRKTGRRTLIQAVYPENSPDFFEIAAISRDIVDYLSQLFPAVPYPYPVLTACNRLSGFNGGGMEHVMMIHDGSHTSRAYSVSLTIHEIGHQYFPFYLGINEQKYGFMDEGWAHMLPFIIQPRMEPASDPLSASVKAYQARAGWDTDLPMMIPSESLGRTSYTMTSYNKSGIALYLLREILGADEFDQILRGFIERWHGRHPTPYDFFFTFEDLSGKDLDWFWQPWYFEHGYPDLAIGAVETGKDSLKIEIVKKGKMPVPIHLVVEFEDATKITLHRDPSIWQDGEPHKFLPIKNYGKIKKIELGMSHIPDIEPGNNFFFSDQ